MRATLRGRPEVILTPAAWLAVRARALAPVTTLRLIGLVDRMLPGDGDRRDPAPGHAVAARGAVLRTLTTLTRRAARRNREHTDEVPAPHG